MRREFRTFAHPPRAMLGVLEDRGLEIRFRHRGIPWQIEGLARDGTSPA
jgi:magnesium-protoporphyrin O-methyltransferase